jgi:hypothetical protein
MTFFIAGSFFLAEYVASAPQKNYAGDEACRSCHLDRVQSYWSTAHHRTSQPPDKQAILGSFAEDKNVLQTSNPGLFFRMDSRPGGFYQTSVWTLPSSFSSRSERIDVVIGSGRVGQTYLYWRNDLLFQLPVSYWVDLDAWINSPGYRDGTANFDRPVAPRCLECHLTYAESVASPNQYRPESLILGISCERCHGPGLEHAMAKKAKSAGGSIVNPAKLVRERQMEVCTQCHGGRRYPRATPFSYVPGEPLDNYYRREQDNPNAAIDVHGNQVGLLQLSRCYQSSAQLTCFTCHDVHQPQRDAAAFSQYCLRCHQPSACGEFPKLQDKITSGCIDCHMPVHSSSLIVSNSYGKQTRALVRSHWIKIYPESRAP